jgi:transcriptional regulator with XRE-family HTH domain
MATQKIDPRKADSTDVEVGRLVRAIRMSRGLSQTELGNQIGVTFQQVQKYEVGANRISMGRLTRVAKLFGVSVPYLLDSSKRGAGLKLSAKDSADYTAALEMLGRIGAARLLKAFVAIPSKPASLRESIVRVVEGAAAAAATRGEEKQKRTKRSRR